MSRKGQRLLGPVTAWPEDAWAKSPGPNPPAADPLDRPILPGDPPDVQAEKRRRIHERFEAMSARLKAEHAARRAEAPEQEPAPKPARPTAHDIPRDNPLVVELGLRPVSGRRTP